MTYANYINTRGNNSYTAGYANTYRNWGTGYNAAGGSSTVSPYGYMVGTVSSYSNYNNLTKTAPAAYAMTAIRANFTAPNTMSANDVKLLRNDVLNIAGSHVASDGLTAATDRSFTVNTDTALTAGAPVSGGVLANLINEMKTQVKALWENIKGGTATGLPADKVTGDKILGSDYQTFYDKAAEAAVAQPIPGYLNCANWANNAGTAYSVGDGPYTTTTVGTAGTYKYATQALDDANKNGLAPS